MENPPPLLLRRTVIILQYHRPVAILWRCQLLHNASQVSKCHPILSSAVRYPAACRPWSDELFTLRLLDKYKYRDGAGNANKFPSHFPF